MPRKIHGKHDAVGEKTVQNKKEFTEPKLNFVEPKLTKQGDATKITGAPPIFGTFVP